MAEPLKNSLEMSELGDKLLQLSQSRSVRNLFFTVLDIYTGRIRGLSANPELREASSIALQDLEVIEDGVSSGFRDYEVRRIVYKGTNYDYQLVPGHYLRSDLPRYTGVQFTLREYPAVEEQPRFYSLLARTLILDSRYGERHYPIWCSGVQVRLGDQHRMNGYFYGNIRTRIVENMLPRISLDGLESDSLESAKLVDGIIPTLRRLPPERVYSPLVDINQFPV